MNILPKKRWHVRTKDNIARVRRDEAEAREKEEKRLEKLKFAESEARVNFLRRQSGLPERQNDLPKESTPATSSNSTEHIDLFSDYKTHVKTTNDELEKERKEEREKYEKQIGYLTYLGQDTNEALKLKSWYEVAPRRTTKQIESTVSEKDINSKYLQDPLTLINALLPNEKKTQDKTNFQRSIEPNSSCAESANTPTKSSEHTRKNHKKEKKLKKEKKSKKEKTRKDRKKEKKHKKDKYVEKKAQVEAKLQQKRELIERLRKERLKREEIEKARQDALLKAPETIKPSTENKPNSAPRVVQKYNSQFNPEYAKQNML